MSLNSLWTTLYWSNPFETWIDSVFGSDEATKRKENEQNYMLANFKDADLPTRVFYLKNMSTETFSRLCTIDPIPETLNSNSKKIDQDLIFLPFKIMIFVFYIYMYIILRSKSFIVAICTNCA